MHQQFIHISGLCHSYEEGARLHEVLHDLDFSMVKGESVALLGRSGSGKSTLLNLISGIDTPASGQVFVDGQNLSAMSETMRTLFRRQHIGFIYQFFNLVPSLNAHENIAFSLELNGIDAQETQVRVDSIMRELDIHDKAQRYPSQLSGGEQQRVAIARALIHQPLVVLADEPTGNLDARSGQLILNKLHQLVKEQNSTLLLVTHSLEVAKTADRIVTLEDGILQDRNSDFAW